VILRDKRPAGTLNGLAGRIAEIAYHGRDINVHVTAEASGDRLIARLGAEDDNAGGLSVDDAVWCTWKPDCARILAPGRGAAKETRETPT